MSHLLTGSAGPLSHPASSGSELFGAVPAEAQHTVSPRERCFCYCCRQLSVSVRNSTQNTHTLFGAGCL